MESENGVIKGDFTRNLLSLKMQVNSLLDGAGGNKAEELLDSLSELSPTEQSVLLATFKRAVDKVKDSGVRVSTIKDDELKQFEQCLYEELVDGMAVIKKELTLSNKLEVIDGGKLPTRKKHDKMICLSEARLKQRKKQADPSTLC